MATKVNMNLLNPSLSRAQFQMPKSRTIHQISMINTQAILPYTKNTFRSATQKMQIGNNATLILKKSTGCKSCGR
jgi:hypothetical protein